MLMHDDHTGGTDSIKIEYYDYRKLFCLGKLL